jgi:hypothetical protein
MENKRGGVGWCFRRRGEAAWRDGFNQQPGRKREYAQAKIGKELTGDELELAMTRGPSPDLSRKTSTPHHFYSSSSCVSSCW